MTKLQSSVDVAMEANSTATSILLIRVARQRVRDFASLESYIALPTPFFAGV
jgi:hypothetical protein